MKSQQLTLHQYSNYPIDTINKYRIQNYSQIPQLDNNLKKYIKSNKHMSQILQVPQPSYTQSNLYIINQHHNKIKKQSQYQNLINNIRIHQPQISKYQDQGRQKINFLQNQVETNQLDAQVKDLKQKTIYRQKLTTQPYTPQQKYFGLYSIKNKVDYLRASATNQKSTSSNNNQNTKISNNMSININQNNLQQNNQKIKQQTSLLTQLKIQYNRLRLYLDQLQLQNKKLLITNNQLININKTLNQQKYHQQNNIILTKYKDGKKNNQQIINNKKQRNYSLTTKNYSQPNKSYQSLLLSTQQQIYKKNVIIQQLTSLLSSKNSSQRKNHHQISNANQQYYCIQNNQITHLKNLINQANNSASLINTKIQYLHNELISLIEAVNKLAIMVQQQNTKILQKQIQIDLEIKHTKFVIENLKNKEKFKSDIEEENCQFYSTNTNQPLHENKGKGKVYGKNEDQNSTNNNLQSCKSSKFEYPNKRYNSDRKSQPQPYQNLRSPMQACQDPQFSPKQIPILSPTTKSPVLPFGRVNNI